MKAETRAVPEPGAAQRDERPDLAAWRRRHALRQSSAAQPVRNERKYRRGAKHRKRSMDS
ncbi:hypothetical protein OG225_04140 [Nocardia sp. NBC_01377]|uniref:hypothetical protein n=1 Tax=Nocardia sp. NBC_01377 TaxID=2903595 RepID=UPI0032527CAF